MSHHAELAIGMRIYKCARAGVLLLPGNSAEVACELTHVHTCAHVQRASA